HNERLEFFGDAVLKLLISEYLFHKYPDFSEGELSKIRAQYISDKSLAVIATKLNLGEYILFSANEIKTGGRMRKSNLADAFEAILGAYYFDQGLKKVKSFLYQIIENYQSLFSKESINQDYKSRLQELVQQKNNTLPLYHVKKEEGPAHERVFHISVSAIMNNITLKAHGYGKSKKQAEQEAAKNILEQVEKYS
ncbi:ribonuclease III, partial [Candidatus Margulisiibacteriota bacterium]